MVAGRGTRYMNASRNRFVLDENEIVERFVRSPGPGGQHVNKVATAVQLRFDLKHSRSIPDDVRARLLRLAGKRVTSEASKPAGSGRGRKTGGTPGNGLRP